MREYLFAQVVHYVLTHRLDHDGLSVLDGERREVRQKKDDGDEGNALIRG